MQQTAAISDLDAFPVRQPVDTGQSVVIRIQTESGLSGWGEAPPQPDLPATVRSIESVKHLVRGHEATAIAALEATFDAAEKQGHSIPPGVRSGINMALHDVIGKLTDAPTHQVLGGPTRNKVRAVARLQGDDAAQMIASLQRCMSAGFCLVSVPLPMSAGARLGHPFYRQVRQLLERMRELAGGEVDFALDCGGQLTPAEATSIAQEMESFHLLWLDEPCSRVQQTALAGVAAETVTPLGWGREIETNAAFQDLLRADAIDVLRPDIRQWGINNCRKAAALGETYYVAVAPRNTGGPIATAAALQMAAAVPNLFALEIPYPASEQDRGMRRELAGDEIESLSDGFLPLPAGPGLGLKVSRDAVQRYRAEI